MTDDELLTRLESAGYVQILVHPDHDGVVAGIADRLNNYPILDEDDLSRRESETDAPECSVCRRRHGREVIHACE